MDSSGAVVGAKKNWKIVGIFSFPHTHSVLQGSQPIQEINVLIHDRTGGLGPLVFLH